MNSLNGHLIFFGILMILVFVVDYFFINLKKYNQIVNKGKKKVTNKKKKEVSSEIGELNYLVAKFKLDKKKINYKTNDFMLIKYFFNMYYSSPIRKTKLFIFINLSNLMMTSFQ